MLSIFLFFKEKEIQNHMFIRTCTHVQRRADEHLRRADATAGETRKRDAHGNHPDESQSAALLRKMPVGSVQTLNVATAAPRALGRQPLHDGNLVGVLAGPSAGTRQDKSPSHAEASAAVALVTGQEGSLLEALRDSQAHVSSAAGLLCDGTGGGDTMIRGAAFRLLLDDDDDDDHDDDNGRCHVEHRSDAGCPKPGRKQVSMPARVAAEFKKHSISAPDSPAGRLGSQADLEAHMHAQVEDELRQETYAKEMASRRRGDSDAGNGQHLPGSVRHDPHTREAIKAHSGAAHSESRQVAPDSTRGSSESQTSAHVSLTRRSGAHVATEYRLKAEQVGLREECSAATDDDCMDDGGGVVDVWMYSDQTISENVDNDDDRNHMCGHHVDEMQKRCDSEQHGHSRTQFPTLTSADYRADVMHKDKQLVPVNDEHKKRQGELCQLGASQSSSNSSDGHDGAKHGSINEACVGSRNGGRHDHGAFGTTEYPDLVVATGVSNRSTDGNARQKGVGDLQDAFLASPDDGSQSPDDGTGGGVGTFGGGVQNNAVVDDAGTCRPSDGAHDTKCYGNAVRHHSKCCSGEVEAGAGGCCPEDDCAACTANEDAIVRGAECVDGDNAPRHTGVAQCDHPGGGDCGEEGGDHGHDDGEKPAHGTISVNPALLHLLLDD